MGLGVIGRLMIAGLVALVTSTDPAKAEPGDVCPSYQNQVIQPISIDAAIAKFKGADLVKDEFETSAQFEARQYAALGNSVGPLVISKDVNLEYVKYNADAQDFIIETYLFDNTNMSYSVLSYPGLIRTGLLGNVDVVISETETAGGSYEASNAYGAKATVVKVDRVTKGIWERQISSISGDLFNTGRSDSILFKMTLSPEKARFIKPQLRIAFLVMPKAPYLVKGRGIVGKTTITRPIEVNDDLTVLVGDIQCAFLTDGSSKVLGSFPTN